MSTPWNWSSGPAVKAPLKEVVVARNQNKPGFEASVAPSSRVKPSAKTKMMSLARQNQAARKSFPFFFEIRTVGVARCRKHSHVVSTLCGHVVSLLGVAR